MIQEDWILGTDNTEIYLKKWYDPNQQPRAIIQLAHGMVEHINRYDEFAEQLVEMGFYVYGNDHRGHGKTGERQGLLGYFSESEGFYKTTEDLVMVTKEIKVTHPSVPIILFGHSMGSFLVRYYIQEHSHEIHAAILSGTGYFPSLQTYAGKLLANLLPAKEPSELMNWLAFGRYNKNVKNKQTKVDWLTRNETAVQDYERDPLAGFTPTARFFYDLMSGLIAIQNLKGHQSIRKDLPILLISGKEDPVGQFGKGVWKTAHLFNQSGLEQVTTMLFEDGRHELLFELNKDEVYEAIERWITDSLSTKF
ncbi:alpha/beta hydrolase [Oceanobacillus manasiensis]|uniref:alpha/beta hydrolase n=1 Tax=Oceanobacillus manasiensis TaxID=586413 RepID=UPI0005AA27AD|nr:alpha/beta hydrolase [Oceanobacillus manasiensis]